MKVRMLTSLATGRGAFHEGDIIELPKFGGDWIAAGFAEPVPDEPEASENGRKPRSRKRKGDNAT